MPAYLGSIAALRELRCPAKQTRDGGVVHTFQDTVEGKRYAQQRTVMRSWGLSTSEAARPEDTATLEAYRRGTFGLGPFWWIAPDAPATNLYDPDTSLLAASVTPPAGYTLIGPVHEGGTGVLLTSGTWYNPSPPASWVGIPLNVPSPPGGGWVTFSAWLAGTDVQLGMVFQDSAGGQVSTLQRPSPGVTPSGIQRVSWSVQITDPSVAQVRLAAINATYIAQPAITWTDQVYPWVVGRGCPSAVIDAGTVTTTLAYAGSPSWGRMEGIDYTITEVAP